MFRRFKILNIISWTKSLVRSLLVAVDILLVRDSILYFPPTFERDIDMDFILRILPFVLNIIR
jgi:hypothetical protein